MTITIVFGKYGGLYLFWGFGKRICLGWVAITLYPFDMDVYLRRMLDKMDEYRLEHEMGREP